METMKYTNTAMDNGYSSNKEVTIKRIKSIHLEDFRTIKDKTMNLGENITLISGKNGTMKTTILGLIAHPFTSPTDAEDIFGYKLKTSLKDVFRLSMEKDNNQYWYLLNIVSTTDIEFSEPIRIYPYDKENRHRIVVGATNVAGKGNFLLNTSYINFKRLFPIIDTKAEEQSSTIISDQELALFVHDAYYKILGKESFENAIPVSENKGSNKFTFGPRNTDYDFNSISSGEDNLGHMLIKMYAFQKNKSNTTDGRLEGIFCIDEIEAGLHPVAQVRFFDFLLNWSKKNNIQVVATTHSLYLIQYALDSRIENQYKAQRIQVNMISTAQTKDRNYNIIENPTYSQAYKELTFRSVKDLEDSYKVPILCEDDVAKLFTTRIIKNRDILRRIEFIHGITNDRANDGTSFKSLKNLVKHGEKLFLDTIFLYDPEVGQENIISNKVKMMILPSVHQTPIEKEIVKYVYDCHGDHRIFKDRERDAFIDQFASLQISTLSNLDNFKNAKTAPFKKWERENPAEFKRLLTQYVKDNEDMFQDFRTEFIESVNNILKSKSLPTFENY